MSDQLDPMTWLCAAIDMANRHTGHDQAAPFRVVKQDLKSLTLLHKDSGAVWQFSVDIIRAPVG